MADLVPLDLDTIVMDNEPDANGVRWRVLRDGIPGYASAVVDAQQQIITGQHGTTPTSSWYRARDMAVNGRALAPTFEAAWDAYYRLLVVTQLGRTFSLVVHEPTPKQLTVELADDADVTEPIGNDRDGWRFRFQLPMRAPYPFKRGLDLQTQSIAAGATEIFDGIGSARAAELQVITTSAGTVDLTGPGGMRLRWGSLPSGSKLTSGPGFIERKRTVVGPGGENLFGLIVQPMSWPAVVAGSNTFTSAGSADVDLTWYPTFP